MMRTISLLLGLMALGLVYTTWLFSDVELLRSWPPQSEWGFHERYGSVETEYGEFNYHIGVEYWHDEHGRIFPVVSRRRTLVIMLPFGVREGVLEVLGGRPDLSIPTGYRKHWDGPMIDGKVVLWFPEEDRVIELADDFDVRCYRDEEYCEQFVRSLMESYCESKSATQAATLPSVAG